MSDNGEDAAEFGRQTAALGRLLSDDDALPSAWQPDDLEGLFRHQCQTRLKDEALDPQACETYRAVLELDASIQQVLLDAHSPPAAWIALKAYARWLGEQDESLYPRACATALYYCAIGAAWLHAGEQITSLSASDQRAGLLWAAAQPWMPPELQTMLIRASNQERA